ncbi:MAG: tRNA (adenosine(37)-N6)-threonylcarbamoyltransferase complex transferase subunit TsaD [Phycisphaerae bacterium]|nr:tRNA (adenosine(37)-N6)-threonylcarbamoyltransferase complex transferase subunit TsaD [Phycisphaerae bacterium]
MALILGIETSCDETSAGVVADGYDVRSNVVATQFDLHAKFGGIVPEIASRAHIEQLDGVAQEALERAGASRASLDAVAVSYTPGLVGSLLIGVAAAKTLAWAWSKPLIGVNHVEAHACSAALALGRAPWPAVALVVSGGHTSLYHVHDFDRIERIGCTTDDAAGEAFDKVASILDLGYPGGPIIDRTAAGGNPDAIGFPRTMLGRHSLDFSFSGIKTAVLYHVHGPGKTTGGLERLGPGDIADIAASFQAAVVDVLVAKTMLAVEQTGTRSVVVGGGVAANGRLRGELATACGKAGVELHLTPLAYCTDNGPMIAALAEHHLAAGRTAGFDLAARA